MYAAPRLDAQELDLCALFQEHDTPPDVDAGYSLLFGSSSRALQVICELMPTLSPLCTTSIGSGGIELVSRRFPTTAPNIRGYPVMQRASRRLRLSTVRLAKELIPHASVVTDLIGHTVFTADYKYSSV